LASQYPSEVVNGGLGHSIGGSCPGRFRSSYQQNLYNGSTILIKDIRKRTAKEIGRIDVRLDHGMILFLCLLQDRLSSKLVPTLLTKPLILSNPSLVAWT
jgi:hypothetical protein